MLSHDLRQRLLVRLRAAAAEHRTTTLPDLPAKGHALGLSLAEVPAPAPDPPPPAPLAPLARDASVLEELDLRLGAEPWQVAAMLIDLPRRMVRVLWEDATAVTTLGEGIVPRSEGDQHVLLDADRAGTVLLAAADGALYVLDVEGSHVQEWRLPAPVATMVFPARHLPEAPWQVWREGLTDPVLGPELDALAEEGTDEAAMMAAGALLVHDDDGTRSPTERIARLLSGQAPERRSRAWLAALDGDALAAFEAEAIFLVNAFGAALVEEAAEAGWSSPAEVPRELRVERDRWTLAREALRERGAGAALEEALTALDVAVAASFSSPAAGAAALEDDRLVMAAALHPDGWWTAGAGAPDALAFEGDGDD